MRTNTAVATQALTLFNGEFVNRQARYLAQRLVDEAPGDWEVQVDLAFRSALGRPPGNLERTALLALQDEEEAGGRLDALIQLCRVLFNMNEFVYTE